MASTSGSDRVVTVFVTAKIMEATPQIILACCYFGPFVYNTIYKSLYKQGILGILFFSQEGEQGLKTGEEAESTTRHVSQLLLSPKLVVMLLHYLREKLHKHFVPLTFKYFQNAPRHAFEICENLPRWRILFTDSGKRGSHSVLPN